MALSITPPQVMVRIDRSSPVVEAIDSHEEALGKMARQELLLTTRRSRVLVGRHT